MDTLKMGLDVGSIHISDSIRFPNSHMELTAMNDHSIFSIKTSADNTLNDAEIFADVYTFQNGFRLQFRPSSFVLNEKKWNIEKNGELVIRNNNIDAKNVLLTQGFQEIKVETEKRMEAIPIT